MLRLAVTDFYVKHLTFANSAFYMQTISRALLTLIAVASGSLPAAELHVALTGRDTDAGTQAAPLRTIQRAAERAQPGDVILVHEGIYRERINPPRGGASESQRITFQPAPGENAEIRGSEVITNWFHVGKDTWKATVPNSLFGNFNPYQDLIRGDWFDGKGRSHHTGAVYLNGEWLAEAVSLDEVLRPIGSSPLWFGQVDSSQTSLWAQFKAVNPNEHLVEINVRQTVFYPDQPGRNYITVRGFGLRHAATPWAPPTAEQPGLIGTHWSKGWVIEDNLISHSICSGITLGKYGDQWDNTSANTAEGYVATIERALKNGWSKENIGHHVVRNNTISHCEQAGIVGSMGAAFSKISHNRIHDIHVRRLFTGAEMAGIKLHAAIDTEIRSNYLYRTCLGLWLDWMAQGTRVSGNLFRDNSTDLFVEVNHGPFVVDNNLFLSGMNLLDMSEGGAYVHNLFSGRIVSQPEPNRATPYHPAHTTKLAGLARTRGGDNRFYNNVFIAPTPAAQDDAAKRHFGLAMYDPRELPLQTGGNLYLNGALPYKNDVPKAASGKLVPNIMVLEEDRRVLLMPLPNSELAQSSGSIVTTALLGRTTVSKLPYEQPDGSPLRIDTDYFGRSRAGSQVTPGPFEAPAPVPLVVWEW